MGTLKHDYFGRQYTDDRPAFIALSEKLVVHRYSRKLYDTKALKKRMADDGYTPGENEIGKDDEWAAHTYSADTADVADPSDPDPDPGPGPDPDPDPDAVYGDVVCMVTNDGVSTAGITFFIAEEDGAKAGTIKVEWLYADTKLIEGLELVAINEGDDVAAVSEAVAAMIYGKQDAEKTVTVHASGGSNVTTIWALDDKVVNSGMTITVTQGLRHETFTAT